MKKKVMRCLPLLLLLLFVTIFGSVTPKYVTLNEDEVPLSFFIPTNTPEYYGAYGDGIHDDTAAIQKAFDKNRIVSFSSKKTYKLVSNGLYIRNNLIILGNDATILVDDSYAPTESDFYSNILRSYFAGSQNLSIYSLNFKINITKTRYQNPNHLVVLQPTYIDNVTLNKVNINVAKSNNKIIDFWMNHGCNSLKVSNCTFSNLTTCGAGGVFWLSSMKDSIKNKYHAFQNVSVSNCQFISNCGDEAIAIWGPNNIKASFNNIVIDWNNKSTNPSRPINILADQNNKAVYNISFKDSSFSCSGTNNSADSMIGIATKYASNTVNVNFQSCNFTANIRDCFIRNQMTNSSMTELPLMDYLSKNVKLNFTDCKINCNKTITGCNKITSSYNFMSPASDVTFNNCDITCRDAFAYLEFYSTTKWYYTPTISVVNSTVKINNPIAFIFKTTKSATCGLSMNNVAITMDATTPSLVSYHYNVTPSRAAVLTKRNEEKATTSINQVTINGISK